MAFRQHVIEKLAAGIDDDAARGVAARVLNDVAPVLLRNGRLRVGQIGHQLLVARAPADLGHGCKRLLHAAAEHQPDNYEYDRTHIGERAYSSSKRLIVRHKVVQQREQFYRPLDHLAFQITFLDQFDLPVG